MTKLLELLPNLIYDSFTLKFYVNRGDDTEGDERNSTFNLRGRFSGDQIAGMYFATRAIINSIIYNEEYDYDNMCIQCKSGRYTRQICTKDDGDDVMTDFLRYYIYDEVEDIYNNIEIPENKFALWMQNPVSYMYELIIFNGPEFIQGFKTICDAFQVDYQNYILSDMFKYDDLGNLVVYQISQ